MFVIWKSSIRARLSTKVSVVLGDDYFEIRSGKKILSSTRWPEVMRATAFKADILTTDLLCVRFDRSTNELSSIVHGEMLGFDDFVDAMSVHLRGLDRDWHSSVMMPPFARNEQVIWSRSDEN